MGYEAANFIRIINELQELDATRWSGIETRRNPPLFRPSIPSRSDFRHSEKRGKTMMFSVAAARDSLRFHGQNATACMMRPGTKVNSPAITSPPVKIEIIASLCVRTR